MNNTFTILYEFFAVIMPFVQAKKKEGIAMSLRFVIGRAGSGKTQYCLNEIIQKQQQQKGHFILLVPSQYSLQANKELIEKTQGKAILYAEVFDFNKLAYIVFQKRGVSKTIPLNTVSKSMILRKVLNQNKNDFLYFKNSLDQQGFIEQLSRTISELFQYQIGTQQLKSYQNNDNLSQKVKDKLFDLNMIMEDYQKFLKNNYISGDELLDLLAERLQSVPYWQNTEIWLDGFRGFTPQEYNIIQQLLRLAKRVTVTLTIDEYTFSQSNVPMFNGFFEPSVTAKKISEIARQQNCNIEQPVILKENKRTNKKGLLFLEKNYFRYYRKSTEQIEGITLFAAPNQYEEMTMVAEEMISLIKKEQLRYRDIAIVTNGLPLYEKSLRGILEEFDIPYFIDRKREIISHPLIECVRSILDALAYHFTYESMFRYLKTGYSLLTQQEIDKLENYVLAYGIKGKKWFKDNWEYGMQQKTEEEKQEINLLKQKVISPFTELYQMAQNKQEHTLLDWSKALFHFLQFVNASEKTVQIAQETQTIEKAKEYQQIWSMLMELLESAAEILGEENITIEEFYKIIEAGLEQSEMGIVPPTADSIIVGDIERSRLPEIKVLFVLGVNEGILPSPTEQGGVFTEGERENLIVQGAELAPSAKRKAFEEQYLIYKGFSQPSEKLYISYCIADIEGKPLRPSSVIMKLKKMFPNLKEKFELDTLDHMATPKTAIHFLGEQMRNCFLSENNDMDDMWKDAYSYYNTNELWKEHISMLKRGLFAQETIEHISKKIVKKIYGNQINTSVSRLEKFCCCPFSFFTEYHLKAKQRQLYQLRIPDLGLLFHDVMEIFSKQLRQKNISWHHLQKEQSDEIIDYAVEEAAPKISNQVLFDTSGNRYLLHRLKRISKRAAWTLTKHIQMGDFEPYGSEVIFGSASSLPPIVIELSGGEKLLLNGKIDRVDIMDKDNTKYVKIIDYKSGQKSFQFSDIFYGLQLQLLIYLDAFLENNKQYFNIKPGAVFYFRMKDPSIKVEKEMSSEEIYNALFKELKMSGLVLNDIKVIQGLDHIFDSGEEDSIMPSVESSIIPVASLKNGTISKRANVADEQNYKNLMDFAKKKAQQIGETLLQGEIAPYPYKKGNDIACIYCPYNSICRFDKSSPNSQYRVLQNITEKEFWNTISPKQTEQNE